MTINEKIHSIRTKKGISRAELAYKIGCSIDEVINYETAGTKVNGFIFLQIISAFEMTIREFEKA